jgi:hypothetical protein
VAELSAIWKGLQLTWDLGYKSIINYHGIWLSSSFGSYC